MLTKMSKNLLLLCDNGVSSILINFRIKLVRNKMWNTSRGLNTFRLDCTLMEQSWMATYIAKTIAFFLLRRSTQTHTHIILLSVLTQTTHTHGFTCMYNVQYTGVIHLLCSQVVVFVSLALCLFVCLSSRSQCADVACCYQSVA